MISAEATIEWIRTAFPLRDTGYYYKGTTLNVRNFFQNMIVEVGIMYMQAVLINNRSNSFESTIMVTPPLTCQLNEGQQFHGI